VVPLPDAMDNEDLVRRAMEWGINSLPLVPLSNGAHRLGFLKCGFTEPANGGRCRSAGLTLFRQLPRCLGR
jgi:hypothetical protein